MTLFSFKRDDRQQAGTADPQGSGFGRSAVVVVLLLLLASAGAIGYFGWTISNADVPLAGYVAMALGVVFSLVVGVGLMALVFYSSRKGYDEPAVLVQDPGVDQEEAETEGPRGDR